MRCQWPGRNVSACATMGFTDSPTAARRDARPGLSVVQPDGSAWCPATRELAAVYLRPAGRHHGLHASGGPATCAMSRPPRAAVITTSGRRSVSSCTGCAARSPPWAGRTFWCSPAGSVSRSRRACRCRHRAGFPRRRHRRRQQQRRAWRRARPARSGSCVGLACGHVLHSRLLRLADQYPGELQSPTREFHGCDQTGRARSWMPGLARLAAVQATDTRN